MSKPIDYFRGTTIQFQYDPFADFCTLLFNVEATSPLRMHLSSDRNSTSGIKRAKSQVIISQGFPSYLLSWESHCKEKRWSIAWALHSRRAQDLLHGCGFTVKHLSALLACWAAGRACLGFIGSCGSADDGPVPHRSTGLVKVKGRNSLLKRHLFLLHVLRDHCFTFAH